MWKLFDWFFKDNSKTPYINREDFIEEINGKSNNQLNDEKLNIYSKVNEMQDSSKIINLRKELDDFLNFDFGPQGYTDALINPDSSNSDANKEILKSKLKLIIERVLTIYKNKISDFDFHIKTRTKNAMLDTVDEINSEKDKCLDEIKKIESLLSEVIEDKGIGYIVIQSYSIGFNRGLAALTAIKIFGQSFKDEKYLG